MLRYTLSLTLLLSLWSTTPCFAPPEPEQHGVFPVAHASPFERLAGLRQTVSRDSLRLSENLLRYTERCERAVQAFPQLGDQVHHFRMSARDVQDSYVTLLGILEQLGQAASHYQVYGLFPEGVNPTHLTRHMMDLYVKVGHDQQNLLAMAGRLNDDVKGRVATTRSLMGTTIKEFIILSTQSIVTQARSFIESTTQSHEGHLASLETMVTLLETTRRQLDPVLKDFRRLCFYDTLALSASVKKALYSYGVCLKAIKQTLVSLSHSRSIKPSESRHALESLEDRVALAVLEFTELLARLED